MFFLDMELKQSLTLWASVNSSQNSIHQKLNKLQYWHSGKYLNDSLLVMLAIMEFTQEVYVKSSLTGVSVSFSACLMNDKESRPLAEVCLFICRAILAKKHISCKWKFYLAQIQTQFGCFVIRLDYSGKKNIVVNIYKHWPV